MNLRMRSLQLSIFASLLLTTFCSLAFNEVDLALVDYLKNSNFLSPDLKQVCKEYPEFFYQLGTRIAGILYFASQRPENATLDEIEVRIKFHEVQLQDFLIAQDCGLCYGEAALINNNLQCLSKEPTSKKRNNNPYWLPSLFLESDFQCLLCEVESIISMIGQRMDWSNEKIVEEKRVFKEGLISILQTYSDECIVLNTHLIDKHEKKMQQKLKDLRDSVDKEKKIAEKNVAKRKKIQSQIDSTNNKSKNLLNKKPGFISNRATYSIGSCITIAALCVAITHFLK